MSTKWTPEQQQVIHTRGCNLLVSAAAGSGKTAVLVERILSMLTDEAEPVDIDRLLVVTFTNAAAGEMKDRIRAALEERIAQLTPQDASSERLMEHLQRQMSLLPNARITTIHSFCQYVIRNYFHTIGLDPGLRIADEGEQKLLQNDVLEGLLEESYAAAEPEFLHMTECFSPGRDDRMLLASVLSLYRFSISFPWPEEWLSECQRMYEVASVEELDAASWVAVLMENADLILKEALEQNRQALKILRTASQNGEPPHPYLDAFLQDEEQISSFLREKTYSGRCGLFQNISWARLSGKKSQCLSDEEKDRVKELREDYKESIGRLAEEYFYAEPEEIVRDMQKSAPVIGSLIDLTGRFARRFAEEKQKKNLMDFDDLEHFALKILVKKEEGRITPTPVAGELAQRYREIMIDEYQDSNLVQEMILTSISRIPQGSYNLFMVGDVKQSIYRFRLARPELFMEKYNTYSTEGGNCRRIDLHKNFRSRPEVLESVNFFFGQLMGRDLGSIQYDADAALYPGAVFEPGDQEDFRKTEVLFLETKDAAETSDETARELEARAVGNRIREIVGRELIWDKEERRYRPARYRDIVILLRTIQGWAQPFSTVLASLGIPAHTGSRTGYFSAVEVQTMLNMLRIIDNPRQDIPLTAVLRSPIVGLDGEALADIRSSHPDLPFYEACMREERLQGFFAELSGFRERAVYMPIHELLWDILERTGYGNYAAAMPGGSTRRANLDMLVEKAIAYEKGSYRGLYNFIRYMENLHKYDVDFGEASSFGEEEDVVRILSIHKSKGLEFPVVFVCGMGKQVNQSDARASLVMHPSMGVGCDFVDVDLRWRRPTLLKRFLMQKTTQENLGEELRVLYVAMTRAKEKLILTGTVADLSKKIHCGFLEELHGELLPYTLRSDAQTGWDWILPALLRNRCAEGFPEECGVHPDPQNPLYARESFCEICCLRAEDLVRTEEKRQLWSTVTKEELLSVPADLVFDRETRERLAGQLSFVYPYAAEGQIPGKVSVSELKKLALSEEGDGENLYEEPAPVPLVPEFLKETLELSGAARGTVYHRLMECLDYGRLTWEDVGKSAFSGPCVSEASLEEEIRRQIRGGFLKEEEAAVIDRRKILAFLDQPIGRRMAAAAKRGELFRERQFVLEEPAFAVNAGWSGNAAILVQGIIDAYFIEGQEIVLVDYKTDFVKMKEASSLYAKYEVQLAYYEMALERLTGRKVREKMIYSFCLDRTITE